MGRRSVALLFVLSACNPGDPFGGTPISPPIVVDPDPDKDGVPTVEEDRNGNGQVDPGETDPGAVDTDNDGIPDTEEVETLACGKDHDRPVVAYDVPGAESTLFADVKVSAHGTLRAQSGRAPGGVFADPDLGVAAALVAKSPEVLDSTPEAEAEALRRKIGRALRISKLSLRSFVTAEGFPAEIARFEVAAQSGAVTAATAIARAIIGDDTLDAGVAEVGATADHLTVELLTLRRSGALIVALAAVVAGDPSDPQAIRQSELADGTNVALRGAPTEHVCDPFVAEAKAAADILFVVDDSGSMQDDQEAVRDAGQSMISVLQAAAVDFRLGVVRMRAAAGPDAPNRGRLEDPGLTADPKAFQDALVVGADGGWEPGLETGLLAFDGLLPKTPASEAPDPAHLRDGAAVLIVTLSDERDQQVECAACGVCGDEPNPRSAYCADPAQNEVIDRFAAEYGSREIVSFAIVGDMPSGCRQSDERDDFEPGQGYVEIAQRTGGQFGSICGDMNQNLRDIARVATAVASTYELSAPPISSTIQVAIGAPGHGRLLPRSRTNGFDFDPIRRTIVFYGDARPKDGEEIVIGYRKLLPPSTCDQICGDQTCRPLAEQIECENRCGDVICGPAEACHTETASCGDPSGTPTSPSTPVDDACGGCDGGQVCDARSASCVDPCERTGCIGSETCSGTTHLCQESNI